MVPRIATVSGIAEVDTAARRLMLDFWPGPLTLVLAAQPTLAWSLTDTSGRVAVRMPLHPVALDLLERTGPLGVVAAAGPAPAGEPAPGGPITADTAFPDAVAAHLAVILDAGPLPVGPPSTVVDLSGAVPVLVRPGPVHLDDLLASCPGLLAPGEGPAPGDT